MSVDQHFCYCQKLRYLSGAVSVMINECSTNMVAGPADLRQTDVPFSNSSRISKLLALHLTLGSMEEVTNKKDQPKSSLKSQRKNSVPKMQKTVKKTVSFIEETHAVSVSAESIDHTLIWDFRAYKCLVCTLFVSYAGSIVYVSLFGAMHSIPNMPSDTMTSIWSCILISAFSSIALFSIFSDKPSAQATMVLLMIWFGELINIVFDIVSVVCGLQARDLHFATNGKAGNTSDATLFVECMSIGLLVLSLVIIIMVTCATYMNATATFRLINLKNKMMEEREALER